MTTYIDQRLPQQIELNAVRREIEPGLQVNRKANGRTTVNQRFSQNQLAYDIGYPPQGFSDSVITAVKNMFRASRGGEIPFRYRDQDPSMSSLTAELIGVGDGVETEFRVKKSWTVGALTATRYITKPVATLAVFLDAVAVDPGDMDIDYDTGWITFDAAPGVGVDITVTGYFDILVRFASSYESEMLTHWLEHAGELRLEEWNDV